MAPSGSILHDTTSPALISAGYPCTADYRYSSENPSNICHDRPACGRQRLITVCDQGLLPVVRYFRTGLLPLGRLSQVGMSQAMHSFEKPQAGVDIITGFADPDSRTLHGATAAGARLKTAKCSVPPTIAPKATDNMGVPYTGANVRYESLAALKVNQWPVCYWSDNGPHSITPSYANPTLEGFERLLAR